MNLDMDVFWNSCKSYFVRLLSVLRFMVIHGFHSLDSRQILFFGLKRKLACLEVDLV